MKKHLITSLLGLLLLSCHNSNSKKEMDEVAIENLGTIIGPTGHYPMLEKPEEFNLLLQQAVEKIKKD